MQIDLWLKTVLEDTVARRINLSSDRWPIDDYLSSPVTWPDNLNLGIELTFTLPDSDDIFASEIVAVPLQRMAKDRASVIQTYEIVDPSQTFAEIAKVVKNVHAEFGFVHTGHLETHVHPDQTLDYAFIDGFEPEMFASNSRSAEYGDDLYYVVRIGGISVRMGLQSVNVNNGLTEQDLRDIESVSFVRFEGEQ